MQLWHGVLIAFALIFSVSISGCADKVSLKPVVLTTPTTVLPVITPLPESPNAEASPSEMALQLFDLPPDYFLRSRTVVSMEELPEVNRDLGWRQGYFVSFYRMNLQNQDITGITQTIGIYPLEKMNNLFAVENDSLLSPDLSTERYEIPFPVTGDRSIAVRETRLNDRFNIVTYTVIFTRKNVFERISMAGTTTDYELLKNVVQKAAAKIR